MIRSLMTRALFVLLGVTGAAAAAVAQTPSCAPPLHGCFILRAASADVETIAQTHDLTRVRPVRPGEPVLELVTGPVYLPPATTLANVLADPLTIGFEPIDVTAVTESAGEPTVDTAEPVFLQTLASTGLYDGPETSFFSTGLWNGYASQPMLGRMKVDLAHADPRPEAMGLGVVAVIDTGVDPDHPLLQGALVPGYDFILERAGVPSEWDALDPATRDQDETDMRAVADQSLTGILDGAGATVSQGQAAEALVDQSLTGILDDKNLPGGFGHGTMVAGIVRLVAPNARIMPLRVFDGSGSGDLGRIIRAIYWAVDNGADVINMSFSTSILSGELMQAISYAHQNGVVSVSSAGNEGKVALSYPSAFPHVVGVASTDDRDARSSFSNYGIALVTLGAAGEAIVTTYPGGLYAAVWGTSFSSAFVAGTVALLHKLDDDELVTVNHAEALLALSLSSVRVAPLQLGAGRLDVNHAMNCGLSGGAC